MPRIGNLLLGADACTLQDEVRDVHTPALGAKTNEPGFSVADSNVEPFGALLLGCRGRHGSSPSAVRTSDSLRTYNVRSFLEYVKLRYDRSEQKNLGGAARWHRLHDGSPALNCGNLLF